MLHFTIIDNGNLSASIWDVIYNRHMLVSRFAEICALWYFATINLPSGLSAWYQTWEKRSAAHSENLKLNSKNIMVRKSPKLDLGAAIPGRYTTATIIDNVQFSRILCSFNLRLMMTIATTQEREYDQKKNSVNQNSNLLFICHSA